MMNDKIFERLLLAIIVGPPVLAVLLAMFNQSGSKPMSAQERQTWEFRGAIIRACKETYASDLVLGCITQEMRRYGVN